MKQLVNIALALLAGLSAFAATASPEEATESLEKQLVYFCSSGSQIADTSQYVGGHFECNWEPGSADRIAHVRLPTILYVGDSLMYKNGRSYSVRPDGEERLTAFFETLDTAGVLDLVHVLYVVDEPNIHDLSETDVQSLQANARFAAARFPALDGVRLATIYADNAYYPGLAGFDVVACDNYGAGMRIFSPGGCYDRLARALDAFGSDQRTWYVVGGTDGEGRADPEPWVKRCKRDARCQTIIAFSYFNLVHDDGRLALGIGQNGLAEMYCRAGMSLAHPEIAQPDCTVDRPVANLTVNDQKEVTVVAGRDMLKYRWWTSERRGIGWWSYWKASSTACGWGTLFGTWEAFDAGNGFEWPALADQAGCAYEVTYVACEASGCTWDRISVSIVEAENPRSRNASRSANKGRGDAPVSVCEAAGEVSGEVSYACGRAKRPS